MNISGLPLAKISMLVCAVVWVWAAIDPVYRFDWALENILVAVCVAIFVLMHRGRPFSDLSCIFFALFFCLHVAGSHYTYSEVPWGLWLKEALHLDRNHYDRIVHFSFGLLIAYPMREILSGRLNIHGKSAYFITFVTMIAISEMYEMMEWIVATIVDPGAGTAFLGTQGDPFDAQKDTGLALCGTVIALSLTMTMAREKTRM